MIYRNGDEERGAAAGWAGDLYTAADRLNPVAKADQPRAAGRISAPGSVIPDQEPQLLVSHPDVDLHDRGPRVLGRVRQRLRNDVVGGDLDLFRQPPADPNAELDRESGAAGECAERRPEAASLQDRWVQAPGYLPQLLYRISQPLSVSTTSRSICFAAARTASA